MLARLKHAQPGRPNIHPLLRLEKWSEEDHPRDDHGRFSDAGGGGGGGEAPQAFISPNVGTLDFAQAEAGLRSARQQLLAQASADIDRALGKPSADQADVIGAWADGAENSLMVSMPGWTHDEARVASAMKGYIADQKSVLLFEPDIGNNDSYLATFQSRGDLATIHDDLLKGGLGFHTLEPTSSGAIVHVYGSDQATADKVNTAAGLYGTQANFVFGRGEFIGTSKDTGTDREQRDDARQQYEAIIREAEAGGKLPGRDLAESWPELRDRWGGKLAETKAARPRPQLKDWNEEDHPREPAGSAGGGQFTSGGGGGGGESAEASSDPAAQQYGLSKAEHAAIGNYINDSTDLNKYLRSGKGGDEEFDAMAKALTSAIDKRELTADAVLWRGISECKIARDLTKAATKDPKSLIGKEVPLGGFQSTTYDENVALEFVSGGYSNPVVLQISVAKGAHALDMVPFADNFAKQSEFLLKEGSLKITKVTQEEDMPIYIHGTYSEKK
jgi:hypothetical protein